MKTFTLLLIGLLTLVQVATAGTLVLSGTVPDRGFRLLNPDSKGPQLVPQTDSDVKVFIADIKASDRAPASLSDNENSTGFSAINGWKKLTGTQTITTSSYIKVEAP